MKKLLLFCAVVLCAGQAFSQDYQKTKPPIKSGVGIYLNPLGAVTFGPMVGVEIVSPKGFVMDAHVRMPGWGLMHYVIDPEADKIKGVGFGVGAKRLFPSRIGGFYAGGALEMAFQKHYGEQDSSDPYVEDIQYVAALANVGYKFQFKSGFFINAGAYLGPSYVYKDVWVHNSGSSGDDSSQIWFVGFASLDLGFMF